MHTQLPRVAIQSRRKRSPFWVPVALLGCSVLAVALASVADAQPAFAGPMTTAVLPTVEVPSTELTPILGSVPLQDLGLDETELGELLGRLSPALESAEPALEVLVRDLVDENPSATLGDLVERLLGQQGELGALIGELAGLEPRRIISSLAPEQLELLLSNLTGGLPSGSLTPEQLEPLLRDLSGQLSGEQLQVITRALDDLLAGATLSPSTVGALAESAGMAPQTLAEAVGSNAESLPAEAPALVGELDGGAPVLGVVKGVRGLIITVLPGETPSTGGGNGGSGNGGSGSAGGSGGSGGQGGPGGTSVASPAPVSSQAAVKQKAKSKPGRLRIITHHAVRGVVTLVISVPGAGRLTVTSNGLRTKVRRIAGATRTRIRLTLRLNRFARIAWRKRHHRLKLRLRATFVPRTGARSTAAVTVSLR